MNTITNDKTNITDCQEVVRVARHVTWVGFWVNAVLAALKILAGIIGRSSAMVADGIHSLSDFITDIIIIVMVGVSRKRANDVFQYGHGKFETFATMSVALVLLVVSILIFYDGAVGIIDSIHGKEPPRPEMIALIMAVISILAKEILFRYTIKWGKRINSSAVIANAWHHRSDAISSLTTLIGIAGAMFLGHQWRILDPIAAMIVSVFIGIVSVKIALPAIKELLEVSLDSQEVARIEDLIHNTDGVIAYHHLRTRQNGVNYIIDVHIKVRPDISVVEGHNISSRVEHKLSDAFGGKVISTVHVEPYRNEIVCPNGRVED